MGKGKEAKEEPPKKKDNSIRFSLGKQNEWVEIDEKYDKIEKTKRILCDSNYSTKTKQRDLTWTLCLYLFMWHQLCVP